MQLSVGTVVEGKVSKITNFGAFINIDGGGSGGNSALMERAIL